MATFNAPGYVKDFKYISLPHIHVNVVYCIKSMNSLFMKHFWFLLIVFMARKYVFNKHVLGWWWWGGGVRHGFRGAFHLRRLADNSAALIYVT